MPQTIKSISNKVVLYCRVSTKEQVEEGNSLHTQEKICREYCNKHGYKISEIFIEQGESAKTADRTELKKLLSYCADKRNSIKAVIIYKLDRLSRNTDDYSQLRLILKRYGVEIKSTSENFENNPVGRFMENTMANIAQFDNDIRTERSVGGMKEAVRSGRYVWQAALGYTNTKVAGRANIAQNEMAPLIKRAFELVAQNQHSTKEIRKILFEEGLRTKQGKEVSRTYFYYLLANKIYTGVIEKFGEKHKGSFEPIITEELFYKVQKVLKRKGLKNSMYLTDNPDFPLRRFVFNEAGKKLTGSWSKGRNQPYPYYRFGNEVNLNRNYFEEKFVKFMNSFSFNESDIKAMREYIEKHLHNASGQKLKEANLLERHLVKLKERQTVLIQKNLDGFIPDSILKEQLEALEDEITDSKYRLSSEPKFEMNFDDSWSMIKMFLLNPGNVWLNSGIEVKLKLQWFQFPKGVYYKKNKFGTNEISSLFKLKNVFSEWLSKNVHDLDSISNNPYIPRLNNPDDPNNKPLEPILQELKEIIDKSKNPP